MMSLVEGLAERTNVEVCVVTLCYAAKKIESRCKALGVRLVGLTVGEGFDSVEAMTQSEKGRAVFPTLTERSRPFMEECLNAFDPDVVVSDQCCFASQEYAVERNIPLVINWTGPHQVLWAMLRPVINADQHTFYFSAGGLFVSYTRFTPVGALMCFNAMDFGRMVDMCRKSINCGNSMVLVHSFWGFETPNMLFHPHIVPVGPIEKVLPTSPDFSHSHPELHSFLHTARKNHRKLLLVTTGTMVRMEAWMVLLLWEAFERLSRDHETSLVWSLKEEQQKFLSQEQLQHPAFHFSTWLPQPALIASDMLDGVLTHCGWNGTTECLSGGKPVVVLPFFVDQMANARLLLAAGCATSVAPIPAFTIDPTGRSSYTRPTNDDIGFGLTDLIERFRRRKLSRLTLEKVVEGCQALLHDPRYTRAAQKLKALGSGPGKGRAFACDLIEHAGHHGLRHLTDSGEPLEGEDPSRPRAATHANRVTGHRPLVITLAMCAFAGAAVAAVRTRCRR